jgi:hypothetical protein
MTENTLETFNEDEFAGTEDAGSVPGDLCQPSDGQTGEHIVRLQEGSNEASESVDQVFETSDDVDRSTPANVEPSGAEPPAVTVDQVSENLDDLVENIERLVEQPIDAPLAMLDSTEEDMLAEALGGQSEAVGSSEDIIPASEEAANSNELQF